ncbi:sulfite exporter TauE/SafE family protein [Flavobacterium sp.]|uniref:sulfite exporter TauE/SafE family protein n=1 Tax=Flavobacterium sp. TaxID=239 RepID=UPI0026279300|nr:sulfite exporter TauE/SafE family protein [Flavobacterium sp.]
MESFFGYIGALCIGLILGLTGGGGSILTVPVLVYLLGIPPVTATAYSLFIVGTTSGFGAIRNYFKGMVAVKTAFLFAIPSFIAVFLTRRFLVPALPDTLIKTDFITLSKNTFLMGFFAIIMFLAALAMLRKKANGDETEADTSKNNFLLLIPQIFLIGVVIGLIGAGGGFLIIPSLVFFAKLPMKKAVGTSLLIIAINSLIGFTGDLENLNADWTFLLTFSLVSVFGIFAGIYLNRFVNETQLKKGFGWFVLVMAVYILLKESFHL